MKSKRCLRTGLFFAVCLVTTPKLCPAQSPVLAPVVSLKSQYDDNIFLTRTDQTGDHVHYLALGVGIEPRLSRHELKAGYMADFEYFSRYTSQNTENHSAHAAAALNFNGWRVEADTRARYYESRSGSEDTARVPRASNAATAKLIFNFNKIDQALIYTFRQEDYRSDAAIGSYAGENLTYQDLDADEHAAELEYAIRFWPKTALLLSGRYGKKKYDTGRKPDSQYRDALIGLKGAFFKKGTIEGKVGYRTRKYDDASLDGSQVIFEGSLVEEFTAKDTLELGFERTSSSSIYQEAAYFLSTSVSTRYVRNLTNSFFASLNFEHRRNSYPEPTTEGALTARRRDNFINFGAGLGYRLAEWGIARLDYTRYARDSNFEVYNYRNNRVSLGTTITF